MKFYTIIIFSLLPWILFAQDPDVRGEPIYSQSDNSGTPFQRKETVCFELLLGASGSDLVFPPMPNVPFSVNVSTANMIDRTVEFIEDDDSQNNFFDLELPNNPDEQIVFTQNATIPFLNYSKFVVCGTIPETASDGAIVSYQANGIPGGYANTNVGDDNPANQGEVLGTLPIELLRFTAAPVDAGVELEWETATEINNSHFEIQRSADGRQYQKIGEMAGQGTTSEIIAYSFTDVAPLNGKSYYRLKQVDYNGAYEYSHVEEVNRDSDSALKLFPNPVAAGSQFRVEGRQIRSVQVFNILGQLVLEESYDRPQNRVFLSTDHLAQGMYITRINNTTEKRMIIK